MSRQAHSLKRWGAAALVLAVPIAISGCGSSDSNKAAPAKAGSGKGTITVWSHQGQPSEVAALKKTVASFNASGSGVTAKLKFNPEADYTKIVQSTDAGQLGDVLEYDGPTMSSEAYAKKLGPITDLVDQKTVDNQTDSVKTQNTYRDGKLYGVSMFDSGLGIYANKAKLQAAGVKWPTSIKDAWTADEFTAALKKLAAKDPDHKVLDLEENNGGEWPTYGYTPSVWSAGALLIKDDKAEGNMDSAAAVKAVKTMASWKKYTDANGDGKAFLKGRVALSWVGHWMYGDYSKKYGKNLLVLPFPDFGQGPKTGNGSWAWGINPSSKNGKAAGKFLDYLVNDQSVTDMTDANSAPPGTKTVLATDKLYKPGGPLALFAEQLKMACKTPEPTKECVAHARPVTPAYPVISKEFSAAFFDAYDGGDAQAALTKAAKTVDADLADNNNYK